MGPAHLPRSIEPASKEIHVHKRMPAPRKRTGLLLSIVVPIVFVAMLVVAIAAVMGTNKRVYVVHTGSMNPTIPIKSAVVVAEHSYHLGQVITFRESGAVVTHRFIGVNADGTLVTKGDANTTADPWKVTRADVIGGVVAAPRGLGYWLVYLRNPAGFGSVLGSVLCITLIWSIANSVMKDDAAGGPTAVMVDDDSAADLYATPELVA